MYKNMKDFEELSQEARLAEYEERLNELESKTNKEYPNSKPPKRVNKSDRILNARLIIELVSLLVTIITFLVIFLKFR